MALADITQSRTTDLDSATTSYGTEPWNKNLDGFVIPDVETKTGEYITQFSKWHGLYRQIPEFQIYIDTYCRFLIGKKLNTTHKPTSEAIKKIKGNGKDNLKKILLNIKRVSKICGNGFGEIIPDGQGRLINIKPLDPGTIKIKSNEKLMITGYDQVAWKEHKPIVLRSWSPDKIFHIANKRIADEITGISEAETLFNIIKWRHQVMNSYAVIIHRYLKPTYFYEVDTDDETEMANIKTKIDNAIKNFENVIVPKGTFGETQKITIANQAMLDPMPWMNFLKRFFQTSSGVPDIVQGEARESAVSAANLNYISFKERIIQEQEEYSDEIKMQLGLEIKFDEPREIEEEKLRILEEQAMRQTNELSNKKRVGPKSQENAN